VNQGTSGLNSLAGTESGQARISTSDTSSSLTFKVKTAEGDTVELSISAASQLRNESASYQVQGQSGGGQATIQNRSRANQFQLQLKVNGDLNDQELQDIGSLLQSLASGNGSAGASAVGASATGASPDTGSTISSYSFAAAYSQRTTQSSLAIYG
jgi:hypothetical protein